MKNFIRGALLFLFLFSMVPWALRGDDDPLQSGNVILIFIDDQGYRDLGSFGSPHIDTPHIDRLAREGMRLTDFYVAAPVCTPSRAALLTGSYPKRVGLHRSVIFPQDTHGLNPDEVTIAEILKERGYATSCIGKWHLGHHEPFLPTNHGFDSYFGVPYSNDMSHPDNEGHPSTDVEILDQAWENHSKSFALWNAPLMRDEDIIEIPVDQRTLTSRYTDEALQFVEENREGPFFLYLAHSMPHVPLFVHPERYHPDPQRAYELTIEEIDHHVGRLVRKLEELGIAEETLVLYTSDNGPWLSKDHHGGSALPLRDGKQTTFEGGMRVPCVIWAPGMVEPGRVVSTTLSTLDIMPTIAEWTGASMPEDRILDGRSFLPLLEGKDHPSHDPFFYYSHKGTGPLEAVRDGKWKFKLTYDYSSNDEEGQKVVGAALYNLEADIGESVNVAHRHPEVVKRLTRLMEDFDAELTSNIRPRGEL